MSHSDWLRQFDLSSTTKNDAMAKAAEILESRRLKHLDFTMTAGTGEGAAGGDGAGQGAPSGSAGGDQGTAGDGSSGAAIANPDGKIAALTEEKDRQFAARQAAETKLAEYQAAEEERKRASQDELTNTKQDLERAQAENAKLQDMLNSVLLDNAFLTDNDYQWQNPARVLKLVDRDSVQIDGDKVTGVKDALKALAESDPYLLKPSEGQQTQDQGKGQQQRTTSGPTAPAGNGQRDQSKGQKTPEELKRKYAALRR